MLLCFASLSAGLSATPASVGPEDGGGRFGAEPASPGARHIADWVVASGDNRGLPFVIVDKRAARVFVFRSDGHLRGAAPALLGLAYGDHTIPGIGSRHLSRIRPEERTTPAGRFVAALGRDLKTDILWVDYDAAISLHRVITSNLREHRLERLATATIADNRISYGCINVPAQFFDDVVLPTFIGNGGIVYILPEVRSLTDVFPGYGRDVSARPSRDRTDPAIAQPSG
jgi:hypothetical protein